MIKTPSRFLRIIILFTLIAVDLFLVGEYVKANNAFPFRISPSVEKFLPSGTFPLATPVPAATSVNLEDTDWQGNALIGKVTNENTYPIFNTQIQVSISYTKDPWQEEKNHTFTIPTIIEPGKSLYFSKTLSPEKNEIWWTAIIAEAQEHIDQEVEKTGKDLKVSDKQIKSSIPVNRTPEDTQPWGIAKQLDEVTWTVKVGQDERMATPQETLLALNEYRARHNAGPLTHDENLAVLARDRAKYLNSIKSTDKHAGFKAYIEDEENIKKLGFWAVGENSGYGYKLIGVHQIEWIYASDEGHNKNQLDPTWSHVGIGIEGLAVVFIFGGWKI